MSRAPETYTMVDGETGEVLSSEPWSTAPESLRALYLRAGRPVDSAAQADEIVPLVRAERHRSGDEVLLLEFDAEGRERRRTILA